MAANTGVDITTYIASTAELKQCAARISDPSIDPTTKNTAYRHSMSPPWLIPTLLDRTGEPAFTRMFLNTSSAKLVGNSNPYTCWGAYMFSVCFHYRMHSSSPPDRQRRQCYTGLQGENMANFTTIFQESHHRTEAVPSNYLAEDPIGEAWGMEPEPLDKRAYLRQKILISPGVVLARQNVTKGPVAAAAPAYELMEAALFSLVRQGIKGRNAEELLVSTLEVLYSQAVFDAELKRGPFRKASSYRSSPLLSSYLEALPYTLAHTSIVQDLVAHANKWVCDWEIDLVRTLLHISKNLPADLPQDMDGIIGVLTELL
ncbi:hypothetical protein F5879DRAFT_1050785 [Lentinula edodes]|nr:hypothetical protein F5879DRAFT_1050785 [Lentinula edodes]